MQVSIPSKTIPPPPGHDLKEAKPSPRDNRCVQKTCPRDKTGSQKPHPPGHRVSKFHEYICKLRHYFKRKALWSQQIRLFFNEETDYCSIYHVAVTRVKLRIKALHDMYNRILIIF